jgi:hypothetical protein
MANAKDNPSACRSSRPNTAATSFRSPPSLHRDDQAWRRPETEAGLSDRTSYVISKDGKIALAFTNPGANDHVEKPWKP